MRIISHRGYWRKPVEKNSMAAFKRSFEHGFGVETDFRDWNGDLVVSHDPPLATGVLPANDFFELVAARNPMLPLAINVKADGLQDMLAKSLAKFGLKRAFLFDMSVPDALVTHRQGLPFYTRESELERPPSLYQEAMGVWMDAFFSDWITVESIQRHLLSGKEVCLVSPELHNRHHLNWWEQIARSSVAKSEQVSLCTDFPEQANTFFNG